MTAPPCLPVPPVTSTVLSLLAMASPKYRERFVRARPRGTGGSKGLERASRQQPLNCALAAAEPSSKYQPRGDRIQVQRNRRCGHADRGNTGTALYFGVQIRGVAR